MSYLLPPETARCRRMGGHAFENLLDICGKLGRRGGFCGALALGFAFSFAAGLQAQFGPLAVGGSATQNIPVTAQATGTVSTVEVLTAGGAGLDFAAAAGGTCNAGLVAGGQCTQPVTFTPAYPGMRAGAVVLLDSGNNVLGTAFVNGTGMGGLGLLVPSAAQSVAADSAAPGAPLPVAGTAWTLAGDGQWQDSNIGDGGPAAQAELFLPSAVAVDGFGNFYIADSNHQRIRMVCAGTKTTITGTNCPAAGTISTVAGAVGTQLRTPSGVAVDGAGNLYIADTGNHVVREISAATGTMTTVAGTGTAGYSGDNGPATAAELSAPFSLAVDAAGNLYVADSAENVIRAVCASPGMVLGVACNAAGDIVTVAGTGTAGATGDGGQAAAAQLNGPLSVAVGPAGDLFVADTENDKVRAVCAAPGKTLFGTNCTAAGMIFTVTGDGNGNFAGDGGLAAQAEVNAPAGLALDPAGDLYIADTQNNRIRKINAATNVIITLAGDGGDGFSGDGGAALAAGMHGPYGLAFYNTGGGSVAHLGDLLVSDYLDQRVRSVQSNLAIVNIASPVRQGYTSPAPTTNADTTLVTVENDGNAALDLTTLTAGTNTQLGSQAIAGITFCSDGNNLSIGTQCTVEPIFAPAAAPALTSSSEQETGNIDVNNDVVPSTTAANSPLVITVNGTATLFNPTQVVLTAQPNPSTFGQSVTLTATVSITSGSGMPTGSVDFFDGATKLDATAVSINGSGVAAISISTLAVGTHQITATYNGDSNDNSSTSTAVTEVVDEATATALQSSQNPSNLGNSVTFTATVTTPSGGGVTPDETVTFFDNGTSLATVPLSGNTATYSSSTLTQGIHPITAVYSGDSGKFINGSASAVVNQDVLGGTTLVLSPPAPNPSVYGTAVGLTVTVTSSGSIAPTGSVSFLDGGNTIGTAPIQGNGMASMSISTLAVGAHTITATYAGNSNVAAGTSNAQTLTVNTTTTTTSISASPSPGIAGKPIVLASTVIDVQGTATVTGSVTFTSGSTILCQSVVTAGAASCNITLGPGSYSIVASYGGNADAGTSASNPLPYVVNAAVTTTTVSATPTPGIAGKPTVLSATVTDLQGVTITGNVAFTSGSTSLCQAAVGSSGAASCNVTLSPGSYAIVASYAGTTDISASASQPLPYTVNATTTTTAVSATPAPGIAGKPTVLTATVTDLQGAPITGNVTFNSGSTNLCQAAVGTNGAASCNVSLAPGNYSIVASYGGNTDDGGSASQPLPYQVVQATTQVALTSSASSAQVLTAVVFKAVVSGNGSTPTGQMVFSVDGAAANTTAVDSTGTATFSDSSLAVGNHQISATYTGDANDAGSSSSQLTETITAIPTVTALGTTSTSGASPQAVLVATTIGSTGPTPTGSVTFKNGNTVIGSATLDSSGVATLNPSLLPGNYTIVAEYGGDSLHSPSSSQAVSITGAAESFSIAVAPPTISLVSGQNGTVAVTIAATTGFSDTVGMGCLSLPASVNCHFSSNSVKLAAGQSQVVQLTIDTNAPLSGGQSARVGGSGDRGISLAGLFLPGSLFFGFVFWRFRRRHVGLLLGALVLFLTGAFSLSGCGASFSQISAAAGTYTIQVGGVGSGSNVSHYQNVTLTVTK